MSIPADQRLRVRFGSYTAAVFAYNTANSWMVVGATMAVPLLCGGNYGLFCAVIAAVVIMAIIHMGYMELASAFPSAGAIASCGWFMAKMVLQLISLWHADYAPSVWHAMLIHLFLCALALVSSTRFPTFIRFLGSFTLGLSLCGFVVSLILAGLGQLTWWQSGGFRNTSGWPDGWAMIIAITSSLAAFSGLDSPAHLAREIRVPWFMVPNAIGYAGSFSAGAAVSWAIVLGLGITDIDAVAQAELPILEVYKQTSEAAPNPKALVTFWALLYLVVFYNMLLNLFISSGRVIWSFAKCGGLETSHLTRLDRGSPLRASALMFGLQIPAIFLFCIPGFTHASLANLAVFFQNITLALPQAAIFILGRGRLATKRSGFGSYGYAINAASTLLVAFFSVILLFPTSMPVTGRTMNYMVVVVAILVLLVPLRWSQFGFNETFSPQIKEQVEGEELKEDPVQQETQEAQSEMV
ncbi:uncharacterized protein NECHADRAFT_87545 [Fusarium vanettenii 77-13-4]|uniref:Amino acid permease/ SLC12A domain-containing protein n=1 Tax=Fusarium vanettenii (strain ATCC MYA-4622 / CBS 123669 / FGSC 9596 / NRRL 45880 / 77-13-4) TaxID=660122 RepID=C7ZE91_FUSV7|nr:uncharacterized protein NECHADRAFT_87545 [Fusarium vanettenii 77-13-4]EEU37724.1 hypothetical protein NECHADRAFT_87545 [Fusarium vanettenii 77-13-4]